MKPFLELAKTVYEQQTKNLLFAQPFEKDRVGKKNFTQSAHTICYRYLPILIFLIFISTTAIGQTPIFTAYLQPDGTMKETPYTDSYDQDIYVNNYIVEWKFPLSGETLGNTFELNLIGGSQGIDGTTFHAELQLKTSQGETYLAGSNFFGPYFYNPITYQITPREMTLELQTGIEPTTQAGDTLLLQIYVVSGAAGRIMYGTNVGNNYLKNYTFKQSPGTPINSDGGFEEATLGEKYADEIPGWEVYCFDGTGTFEVVDDPVKEGNRALCVEVTELGTLPFSIQAINFPFPIEPNTEYTYSVWAKSNKEGSVVSFLVEDPSYNIWEIEESVPMTTEWQYITFTFTTPDTATSGRAPIRFSESANDAYLPVTFYIDDLQIVKSVPNDVGVLSLNIPNILQIGQSMPIDITIKNFGTHTQSNFPVSYSIDGGTPVTENFTGSLPAGSSASFIFAEQWNPQVEDEYHLLALTELTNDQDQSNDTAEKEVTVTTISDQGLKLYLDGDPDDAKLISSEPEGYTYELTTTGSSTITYGDYFLTDDIISGTDYTLKLLCASTSTKDFTAVVKIGNQEVVNTTFSVSGAQYKYYEISVVGIDPNITGSKEIELLVTVNGEGFGVTSGIKWGAWINSYIVIPSQFTQVTVDRDQSLPNAFYLSQNYPNPFNPVTTIEYRLPQDTSVSLRIFNIMGELVKSLIEERQSAGYYKIQWDGRDENGHSVAGGLYIYHLKADGFSQSNKMVLIR